MHKHPLPLNINQKLNLPYILLPDSRNNNPNFIEPFQMGQGKAYGEILRR